MTLHFQAQRRIQHLVIHVFFFQKTPHRMFDWVQNTRLEKKVLTSLIL